MAFREKIVAFGKREAVLCISAACALLSMLAVPPSAACFGYIDFRVLCLLFCLMAVVAGFQECGLFGLLARRLLSGCRRVPTLILALTLLPFFCSMLVTNDVSLITFVPFTILILHMTGYEAILPRVVALQTVAANLGSMATPVGNPQNLFLYTKYSLSAGEFFSAVLPIALASLLALSAAALISRGETVRFTFGKPARIRSPKLLTACATLFALCLLTVFRVLDFRILTVIVLAVFLIGPRRLLLRVDYSLLLTFVCFFVFAGNIGHVPAVRQFLTSVLDRNALLSSALASQVISNVPAAVLLSGFTKDWRGLLLGVDIGGLGTPIASLASLISLRLYARSDGARTGHYLAVFTLANLLGLAVLLPLAAALIRFLQ